MFVRKLIASEPGVSAECETQFSSDDPMFAGHFPGDPLVPGVILTEALAQTAGIAAASAHAENVPPRFLLSAIRQMKFFRGVRPEEREMFLKWSDDLVSSLSSTAAEADMQVTMDAFAAYTEYMMGMITARKEQPTDDLVSVLVHAEVEGSRLEDHQIVTEVLLLLIGGDETTRHTLSGGTRQLLRHPDQHQRLVNDLELLPNAIEEMLRWTAPVKNMARTITADTEFHGTALKEGEKMLLLFESANFDENMFDEPESFNIERYPNNHLAFGFGTHFCLGNQLARLELSIMEDRLLKRLPDMGLASDAALPLRPANFVSGLEKMPVKFTQTKPLG